jgi:hypothetical protein
MHTFGVINTWSEETCSHKEGAHVHVNVSPPELQSAIIIHGHVCVYAPWEEDRDPTLEPYRLCSG